MPFKVFDDGVLAVECLAMLMIDEKRNLVLATDCLHFVVCLLVEYIAALVPRQSRIVTSVRDTQFGQFLTYLCRVWTAFGLVEFKHQIQYVAKPVYLWGVW